MIRLFSKRFETDLLGIVILLGILQAVMVNIVGINLYILNVFIATHFAFILLQKLRAKRVTVEPVYITIITALSVFVVIGAYISTGILKQLIYNFNMLLYMSWAYLNAGRIEK
ncbi:MAG: hypothetical protein ACLFQB_10085 [Chitinispirillaceae bacterium]